MSSGVDLKQVGLEIIEDEIELGIGEDYFLQFDNVGVLQFPQRFNLSQLEAFVDVLVLLLHFFDGDDLSIWTEGFEDDPKGAVPNRSSDLILLHNNFYIQKEIILTIFFYSYSLSIFHPFTSTFSHHLLTSFYY